MPECIAERFASLSSQEILVSASWYHDEEIIPSYISFSIREGSSGPAFSLVIELDTLEIIRLDSLSKWMNPIPEECIKQWKVISLVQEPDAS